MTRKKYGALEVMGPEHEFSINDSNLNPVPISDKVIRRLRGRIVNNVNLGAFIVGKELQAHVLEFKSTEPFDNPKTFEKTMHEAVLCIADLLEKEFESYLLGLGMHPLLKLRDAKVWSHKDRKLYHELDKIFNIYQHGWLNVQSFQLNLPYFNETEGIKLYNKIANILPYITALSASSPIFNCKIGKFNDNRLYFYLINQKRVPSITGEVIPEYVNSFGMYRKITLEKYSRDLAMLGAPKFLMQEWLNSRGAIFRFRRKTIEIRLMDEQECVKADVSLSCFIRALLRGLMQDENYLTHELLVQDFKTILKDGLNAKVRYPHVNTARDVCRLFHRIASQNCTDEEKDYLRIIKDRIEGSLSDRIKKYVEKKSKKTNLIEAVRSVCFILIECLKRNELFISR